MEIRMIHIAKTFGTKKVINDTTFRIENGSFTTLLGASGCGKTMLVFVKTISEYGTPSTLGRRIGFDVFTTEIHRYATVAPVEFPG